MKSFSKVFNVLFPRTADPKHEAEYLVGLKGAFALQAFIWMFLHTFVPTTLEGVDAASNVLGPEY